jgi:hypothetical protein
VRYVKRERERERENRHRLRTSPFLATSSHTPQNGTSLGRPTRFDNHCFLVDPKTEKPYRRKALSVMDDRYESECVRPSGRPDSVFGCFGCEPYGPLLSPRNLTCVPGMFCMVTKATDRGVRGRRQRQNEAPRSRLPLVRVILSLHRGEARACSFCKRCRVHTGPARKA